MTVYSSTATGNALPIRTIAGNRTGISEPLGVAVDTTGRLYVSQPNSISVFAPRASGNVAPIATIKGHRTGIFYAGGIAVQ